LVTNVADAEPEKYQNNCAQVLNCAKVIFRQESFSTAEIVSDWLGGKSVFASSGHPHKPGQIVVDRVL